MKIISKPDIREDIKDEVNSFRTSMGMLPIYLHYDECYGCKKHADYLVNNYNPEWMGEHNIYESDLYYRTQGWIEIDTIARSETPNSTHEEIKELVVKAIREKLKNQDSARKVLNATRYIAADISCPEKTIAICIRLF